MILHPIFPGRTPAGGTAGGRAARAALLALVAAGWAGGVTGQDAGPEPATEIDGARYDGRAGRLSVRLPRLDDPGIRVDGRLDELAWSAAAVLAGFTQFEPNEGIPAAEPTETLVFYTTDAIYFAIRAFDSRPEEIPALVAERDAGIYGDDWARITLDTYDDERQAYVFYVNPLGIQADGLWLEGQEPGQGRRSPVDLNPDFIWESRGRVVEDGWVAEIRIPYTSIQFDGRPEQTWRLNVVRQVQRLGYRQSWAPLTANRSSSLAQSGRLVGLSGLSPRKLIEVNPVITSRVAGERVDGRFARGGLEPELGLDGRYGITRNLVLGGTVNPDFSQVEADADQITVNERFSIFFPEKRPFFLDGTEIFQAPTRLVHTRRIIDPIGGAKVTGKIGGVNLAYLGALDESPTRLEADAGRALFNLARLRADVGQGSALGVLFTDRSVPGDGIYNRVASADARLLFGPRLSLTAQYAGSWTGTGSGDPAYGALWFASLRQTGRHFGFELTAEDASPEFRTETGFIQRTGDIRARAEVSANAYPAPGSLLESLGFELGFEGFFDHAGFWSGEESSPFERELEGRISLGFRGGRSINLIVRNGYFRFRPEEYAAYEVVGPGGGTEPFAVPEPLGGLWAGGTFARWRVSEGLSLGGRAFLREIPIFAEASRGLEILLGPSVTLRPSDSWEIELSYDLSRIHRQRIDGDSFFSSADIPRLKTQYQFSRSLFARVILQYDLARRVELRDPGSGRPILIDGSPADPVDRGRFLSQVLFSYEPSPRTVFFIGWSRQMEGERDLGLSGMDLVIEGFFAKLSYLLRI